MDVFGYRIGDFIYLTDFNFVPEETKEIMRGAKAMIVSGIRWKNDYKHPTHSTIDESQALAQELGIQVVYYTHLTHLADHSSEERLSLGKFAFDGLSFDL